MVKNETNDSITFVKMVTIGSVNPNAPLSDESKEKQISLLNQCLNGFPKGKIIGKDVSIGTYKMGDHLLTMERTTYHIGFSRKPYWITD